MGGDTEMMVESFTYLAEALLLAIIFVYLILAAQFESFIDPLAIMLSLPLSIVGMAGTLLLTGDTINIMSLIGLIMLMGLVTKNAILLIDYTKVLRERGAERRAALITAGRTRLRPILMTTSAMIFGMLPLFFAIGEGAEFRAPMARAVVGGLLTSTLLTLIVVPVVYSILDDISAWFWRRRKLVHPAAAASLGVLLAVVLGVQGVAAQVIVPETNHPGLSVVPPAANGGVLRPSLLARAQQAATAAAILPVAEAQTPPGTVKVVTLEEALAIAAAQNLDIKKAIEYQGWVKGKYLEERAAALPQGRFVPSLSWSQDNSQSKLFEGFMPDEDSGGSTDIGEIFGGAQRVGNAQFTVNQVLFTWGQVGAAIRAAKLGFGVADEQLRRFRQTVARDVTAAFYNVLVAHELTRIAEEDLAQKQRHLDETTKRQTAGTATDYDVLAARVTVDNARPALIRAQNRVLIAQLQLGFLLAEQVPVDASGTLDTPLVPLPSYDAALATALENRPELGELRNAVGIYGELVTIAKAGNKPRVDFAAAWGERGLWLKTLSSSGSVWNAGFFATVPIFDGWRTKGQVMQAQADRNRVALDERKLRDAVSLEVQAAIDAAREAAEIVTALGSTQQQAEKLVFLSDKGFELGVKTRLEVQDAQQNLRQAQANLAVAQRDYRTALVNLEWVQGTLDDRLP
jgi:HAE1 family hydrophobic/amphiphilic exporter-1